MHENTEHTMQEKYRALTKAVGIYSAKSKAQIRLYVQPV
jgi:hypothetical protein